MQHRNCVFYQLSNTQFEKSKKSHRKLRVLSIYLRIAYIALIAWIASIACFITSRHKSRKKNKKSSSSEQKMMMKAVIKHPTWLTVAFPTKNSWRHIITNTSTHSIDTLSKDLFQLFFGRFSTTVQLCLDSKSQITCWLVRVDEPFHLHPFACLCFSSQECPVGKNERILY